MGKLNYGVVRCPSKEYLKDESVPFEIVEKGLDKKEAHRLCEEYKMSERHNPKVTYIVGDGQIFK